MAAVIRLYCARNVGPEPFTVHCITQIKPEPMMTSEVKWIKSKLPTKKQSVLAANAALLTMEIETEITNAMLC